MSTTIFDVAKYIIEKQEQPITTMKLQKLAYYSQAWHLVWTENELFQEDFQAWANGPVCKELFSYHKGSYKVSTDNFRKGDSSKLTPDQKDTVDIILQHYGLKSAQFLSSLTHREQPWIETRGGLPFGEKCNNIISKSSMIEYYGSLQ